MDNTRKTEQKESCVCSSSEQSRLTDIGQKASCQPLGEAVREGRRVVVAARLGEVCAGSAGEQGQSCGCGTHGGVLSDDALVFSATWR